MSRAIFRTMLLTFLLSGLHDSSYSGIEDKITSKANYTYCNTPDSSKYDDRSLNYIETDPSTFFFKGFSLQFRRSCLLRHKMVPGIGYYRAELPDFWIDAMPGNRNKGGSAKVQNGLDLFADYHLFKANRGLFAGLNLSFYTFATERTGLNSGFTSFVPSARCGARLQVVLYSSHSSNSI